MHDLGGKDVLDCYGTTPRYHMFGSSLHLGAAPLLAHGPCLGAGSPVRANHLNKNLVHTFVESADEGFGGSCPSITGYSVEDPLGNPSENPLVVPLAVPF